MTSKTSIPMIAACVFMAGCTTIGQSTERTVSEMQTLMLDQFRFGQTSPVEVLTFLDASARHANASFSLEYAQVRKAGHEAQLEWLAVRKPDPSVPKVRSPWHTGWIPSSPNPGFALTVTVAQNGTNAISFHEALSILCSVSGLKWKVDQSTVIVEPDKKPE